MHLKTDLYTHIIKYMGSKRELLPKIRKLIIDSRASDGAVLDLFAGTCGVGMALRDVAPIYSNDIQAYSSVISQGCLTSKLPAYDQDSLYNLLKDNYTKNFEALEALLQKQLKTSYQYTELKDWDEKNRVNYIKFMDCIAQRVIKNQAITPLDKDLHDQYKKRHNEPLSFPYMQTAYLFSEMYFSTKQAIAIDSLMYAIDMLDGQDILLKQPLKAALLHAYSYVSAGTGHFAQFRDLSSIESVSDVFSYRKRSVIEYFLRKAEEVIKTSSLNEFPAQSKSFNEDYMAILNNEKIMNNVSIIYADPPYSFVHYSRFYHALEDLVIYDYPEVQFKGRYRQDRHQSPFCIKTKAPKAFDDMFIAARKFNKPILVSYSNTGMISLDQLIDIGRTSNYEIKVVEIDHKHSTMGRQKDKHRLVKEALILALPN